MIVIDEIDENRRYFDGRLVDLKGVKSNRETSGRGRIMY